MFIYSFCTFDEALLLLSKPKEKKILCLVTKQFFMMFGRQTFPVWTSLFKELKQTTMTMTTIKRMSPNERFIDSNNSCARG